ncbi:putative Transposable element Tcb1 transposase-like 9, partial [Homarus americanus]
MYSGTGQQAGASSCLAVVVNVCSVDCGPRFSFFASPVCIWERCPCTMPGNKQLKTDVVADIVTLHKGKKSNKEISAITGVPLRSVQRWTKKFEDGGGVEDPAHKKRPGRPRVTTPRTLKVIQRQVDKEPRISARQLKEKNPQLLGHVAERTVRKILHDDLKYKCVARKKPLITQRQHKNRVAFCRKYLEWDDGKGKKILWSDETTLTGTGNRKGKVYRRARLRHRGSGPCVTSRLMLFHGLVVELFHGPVVELFHGLVVELFHGPVVELFHGLVVDLLHGFVVELFHGPVVELFHVSMAVSVLTCLTMSDLSYDSVWGDVEEGGPSRGKKRARNEAEWKKHVAKERRNKGEAYESRFSKKPVAARVLGAPCRDGCFEKVTMAGVDTIFKAFWEIGDYGLQNAYIQRLVDVVPIKRKRTKQEVSRRSSTVLYHVQYNDMKVQVCKTGFCAMHGLGKGRVSNTVKKLTFTGTPTSDKRGRHTPINNIVSVKAGRLWCTEIHGVGGPAPPSNMSPKIKVTHDQIVAITALHKAGKSNADIAEETYVSLRQVQRWVKRYRENGGALVPTKKKSTGRPRKTSLRALNIVKKQLEDNHRVSARQVKENNPMILGNVSIRTVSRRMKCDLQITFPEHFDQDQLEHGRADGKKRLRWNAVPTIFAPHSDHFDENQYESGRADGLKRLKSNAIPTLFVFTTSTPKSGKLPRKRYVNCLEPITTAKRMPGKYLSDVEKTKILTLIGQNVSLVEIARSTGHGIATVKRLKSAAAACPDSDVPPRKPIPGRPRKTTKATDELLKREVLKIPRKSAAEIKKAHPSVLGNVSERTIQNRLQELCLLSRPPAKKPLLIPRMMKQRLELAKKYENRTAEDWSKQTTTTTSNNNNNNHHINQQQQPPPLLGPRYKTNIVVGKQNKVANSSSLVPREEYEHNRLTELQQPNVKKTREDYRMLRKHDILEDRVKCTTV